MFKDFGRRLQRDVKHIVDGRIANSETASGSHMRVSPGRISHDPLVYDRLANSYCHDLAMHSRAESKSTSSRINDNVSPSGTEEA